MLLDVRPSSIDPDTGVLHVASMQAPHIDYRITGDASCNLWVCITAINNPVRLILWPGSHGLVMRLAKHHGWPDFDKSSEELDKEFARLVGCSDLMRPTLVTIYPGQTLVFHGMLIHAGAPGRVGSDGVVVPCHR